MTLYDMFKRIDPVPEGWEKATGSLECPSCHKLCDNLIYNNESGVIKVGCCECGAQSDVFIGSGRSSNE